jgi:putative transposase
MPRNSRIDAAGALHHIIARGIERRPIFQDESDGDNFLQRLGIILKETGTQCYAWTLIPNHFHLLLKSGLVPISQVMGRLLTGYAVSYNRRHRRSGHLFQNRYKSILCQKDRYFLELVRYLHLNPLRAGIVSTFEELDRFGYCGHAVIMGHFENDWQQIHEVLELFADKVSVARRQYRAFVEEGIKQGRRSDLTGGGLVRSIGGWAEVKAMRRAQLFQKSDERILGDGDFVEQVLLQAREQMQRRHKVRAQGFNLDKVAERVCDVLELGKFDLWAAGKDRNRVRARSLFCYWAARELGISQAELGRKLNISPAAVTFSVKRGEEMVRVHNYSLFQSANLESGE